MPKSWNILEDLARRSGGTFKAGDAAKAGVHPRDLYDRAALRRGGSAAESLSRRPNLLVGDRTDGDEPRRWLMVYREVSLAPEEDGRRWK